MWMGIESGCWKTPVIGVGHDRRRIPANDLREPGRRRAAAGLCRLARRAGTNHPRGVHSVAGSARTAATLWGAADGVGTAGRTVVEGKQVRVALPATRILRCVE